MPKKLKLADASEDAIEAAVVRGEFPTEETETDAENRGAGEQKPPATFWVAADAERLGDLLVKDHYPHLRQHRIVFVYTSEIAKSAGEVVLAKASVVRGITAWMAQILSSPSQSEPAAGDAFFLIKIAAPVWTEMGQRSKEAVLDEVLWQCGVREGTGALYVRKLDVQTSVDVLHRHGAYTLRLKDASTVMKKHFDQPAFEEAS